MREDGSLATCDYESGHKTSPGVFLMVASHVIGTPGYKAPEVLGSEDGKMLVRAKLI